MHYHEKTADGVTSTPASQSEQDLSLPYDEKPKPKPRRFRRWLRWLLAGVLFLFSAGGVYLFITHEIAVNRLATATAEMDALYPGWRLEDIEAARPAVPDEEHGILVVVAAGKLVPNGWPKAEIACFDSDSELLPNNIRLKPEQRNRLRIELESLNPARVEARKLANYSTGRAAIVYKVDYI